MSGNGLPFASVSNGTLGGRLVPRNRMYCDAPTSWMRNVIALNSGASFTASHVVLLNVLITSAVSFFAAAGTDDRSCLTCTTLLFDGSIGSIVIQSLGQAPE